MAKLLVDLWHQKAIVEAEMIELLKHLQFDRKKSQVKSATPLMIELNQLWEVGGYPRYETCEGVSLYIR
jgi:hypothetical protein